MDLLNKFKKKPKERRRIYMKYKSADSLQTNDDGVQRIPLTVNYEKQAAVALAAKQGEPERKLKKRRVSLNTRKSLSGWLFVLPFVIGIVLIYAPVIFNSIMITFSNVTFENGMQLTPVGFDNYKYIFMKDEYFSVTVVNGLKDLLLQIPAIVIFALFMAIILNQKMTGRAVFRAIFFLPVILSTGIIDTLDTSSAFINAMEGSQGVIDDNTGDMPVVQNGIISALDIQNLLGNIKLGTGLVDYVTALVNNIFDIVSRSGVQMLVFLSGLQSISPAIYESCQIEGATAWETFWKITFPMISPMILVNAIYTVIDAFTSADNRVMGYIQKIYTQTNYAHAGAMSWVYVLIVLVFILLVALILKAAVFYQRRD